MMLKMTGAILICISSYIFGLKKSAALEERVRLLNDVERSLVLLSGEIKYASATLPEAMRSVGARTSGAVQEFYQAVYQNISMDPEKNFRDIWNDCIDFVLLPDSEMKADADTLKELGTQMGHLDLTMQLKAIDLCISRINLRQDEALESNRAKGRVYKTFAAACGVLLTLILL